MYLRKKKLYQILIFVVDYQKSMIEMLNKMTVCKVVYGCV